MHKTISFFNHKGGVSKTTTTFHLGWMLAEKGKRVVMIDADPQCNLTGLALGYGEHNDLDKFYKEHPTQNIHSGLAPAFESQPRLIEPIECIQISQREGLMLLPGHVNLSEYEITLGIAQELSGTIQALKNLPGAFNYFISKIAEKHKADYVIVDMNPSLGAINQNFLMVSDYFIIPTAPDYFNVMAIDSLTKILPKWAEWAKKAYSFEILKNADYPFPEPKLKFLGIIIQKFRPRKGKATEGFQSWIDQINDRVNKNLFPILQKHNLVLNDYNNDSKNSYCLTEIPDFNTLIATSQDNQTPVFALTGEMIGHVGTVLEQEKKKRDEFKKIFSDLTDKIISLTI
ncbi:MAG: putative regulatory protein cII [Parcubacteria group bacterium LiPW_30]|nr:MAG: putative regulatory protein cII [Parcubacteria group bacterium LiPW_30]